MLLFVVVCYCLVVVVWLLLLVACWLLFVVVGLVVVGCSLLDVRCSRLLLGVRCCVVLCLLIVGVGLLLFAFVGVRCYCLFVCV